MLLADAGTRKAADVARIQHAFGCEQQIELSLKAPDHSQNAALDGRRADDHGARGIEPLPDHFEADMSTQRPADKRRPCDVQ